MAPVLVVCVVLRGLINLHVLLIQKQKKTNASKHKAASDKISADVYQSSVEEWPQTLDSFRQKALKGEYTDNWYPGKAGGYLPDDEGFTTYEMDIDDSAWTVGTSWRNGTSASAKELKQLADKANKQQKQQTQQKQQK